ncbi:hypothetical protein, partial [Corynebacterium sp.]|uniref:hypothetical protein n=1 Tax=Corynebacterium sp. TaxID=1720 RepID=UPI002F42BB64
LVGAGERNAVAAEDGDLLLVTVRHDGFHSVSRMCTKVVRLPTDYRDVLGPGAENENIKIISLDFTLSVTPDTVELKSRS